uniref:Uncharacterized protein n=1 Tax=Plectus sambesii TaxID=2011161 RepID=A0A914XAL5_9BILA
MTKTRRKRDVAVVHDDSEHGKGRFVAVLVTDFDQQMKEDVNTIRRENNDNWDIIHLPSTNSESLLLKQIAVCVIMSGMVLVLVSVVFAVCMMVKIVLVPNTTAPVVPIRRPINQSELSKTLDIVKKTRLLLSSAVAARFRRPKPGGDSIFGQEKHLHF